MRIPENEENMNDNKMWVQIRVSTDVVHLDDVCSVMCMLDNGLMIEDYSDIGTQLLDGVYGDLIDESILNADKSKAAVSIYVPSDRPLEHYKLQLNARFAALDLPVEIEYINLCEDDWAESWKQYYKPIKVGERLVIVPMWEKYEAAPHEITVLMDPGMAFGTGTHETTRLCASMLEGYVTPGCTMMDVGCGSGILAICAAKLGAGLCRAYDIDEVAVRIAAENVKDNGISNVECRRSDLLAQAEKAEGGYDVICANIVADVIIRMLPDIGAFMSEKTVLILSGIIDEREGDVLSALDTYGFETDKICHENGWCAISVRKKM